MRANPCKLWRSNLRVTSLWRGFDAGMSANPSNPKLGLNNPDTGNPDASPANRAASQPRAPGAGYYALQALLAFSSLHEQIRRRKAREQQGDASAWSEEPFALDEVLQLVSERALAITGANGVAIALAEGDSIICRASAGRTAPPPGVRLNPESGFSAICLRTAQIVRCDDAESDSRVDIEACRELGTRSMVAVPLCSQQRVVGLIEAFSVHPYGFGDGDIRSLNLLAELILAAMKPEEEDRSPKAPRQAEDRAEELKKDRGPKIPSIDDVQAILQVHRIDHTPPSTEEPVPESPTILAQYGSSKSRTGVMVALLGILLALAAGGVVWWKFRPGAESVSANRQLERPTSQRAENSSDAAEGGSNPAADVPAKPGEAAQVRNIRHWSSTGSSTVVIDLQNQVQYEAHRLTDPERIYFDLHDTSLAQGLANVFEVEDALLVRVRVAQPRPGITRVVLETKGSPNFSVSLEPSPYRLVVEVRSIGNAGKPRAKVDLFAPMNPESAQALALMTESPSEKTHRPRSHASTLRIALDAGHGGWDLGTVGRTGLVEKDLVLDIVARLGAMLERRLGAEVIYTRQDDNYIALEKRAEIANLAQADVFLSVHANYSNYALARGVETYYTNTYSSVNARSPETDARALPVNWTNVDIRQKVRQSKRLALSVQRALYRGLAEQSSGIRDRGVKEATYVVLTGTTMPAILAEVSFVSSPDDEQSLRDPRYRQQIAEAIFKGVEGYGSELRKVNIASTSAKSAGSF